MKASVIATLSLIACAATIHAQQAWTLEQCIDYAIDHNITVKSRRADVEAQQISVASARSGYLPQVSAYASQSWSLGRGLTSSNTYADRNTASTSMGAQLSLPLFDGLQTPRQTSLAKANLTTSLQQYEAVKDDVTLNVISAYLQALYTKELRAVAQHQVDLSAYEYSRQSALLEAGRIPETDMLDALSQLEQDRLSLAQRTNDVALALLDLAQLLQLPADAEGAYRDFDIEAIDAASASDVIIPSAADVFSLAMGRNHTIGAARSGITAAARQVLLAKAGYMPRLSFSAGIGSSYYTVSGMTSPPFGRQLKNNYSTSFGLSLSIPIFDGLQTHNSVRRAKVQRLSAELQYDEAEQQLLRSIQQAYYLADGAKRKLAAADTADHAAQKAFEAMSEKYAIGRATPTEYQQAKAKALSTANDALQARYELILRIRVLDFYSGR